MKFNMPACGGCRTCEMACSFKHRGAFIPSVSSIKILDTENDFGFAVLLAERGDGETIPCDGCVDLDKPLCVQYCKRNEDLEGILKEFREKAMPGERGGSHARG